MYENVLKIRESDFPYFRTEQFSKIMFDEIQKTMQLESNHKNFDEELIFLTTELMEMSMKHQTLMLKLQINIREFQEQFYLTLMKILSLKYQSLRTLL